MTTRGAGLLLEFEFQPVAGKNPGGVAVSTGQVTVFGDWQFGAYGSLHFYFNSATHGIDPGPRVVTYTLPAPDGAWHKIEASYDLQFVTIKRDGVVVVRDWLDAQTTEIPTKTGPAVAFNTPLRNLKATPFAVAALTPEVRWQGLIGNSSALGFGPSVWSTFLPANAMVAWGDYVFVSFGYNEGKPELARFHKNNPQSIDLMFGLRAGAIPESVAKIPVDLSIGADGNLYVKRASGKVAIFNPNNGQPIGSIDGNAIAFPAPPPRPTANANDTWTVKGKVIGEPGGYANGPDIKPAKFAHWYIEGARQPRSAACFQNDGKFWLSDTATCRLIRFNADGTPDGAVIHWTPHSYVMALDKADRTRAFNRFIEYRNGVPFRFYGQTGVLGFGDGFSSVTTVNGRTLALTMQSYAGGGIRQLVELTAAGFVTVQQNIPKESRLYKDGSVSDLNKIVADGVTYSFNPWPSGGNHLTATRNGTVLWSALPTGDNTGAGSYDTRCVYTAQPGTFAVAGNYVIVACQMEFWHVGRFTGQGNQLYIFDKTTGKFLRQFGMPMMQRGETDNPPGAASNIFALDAELNPDGSVSIWANDESSRGIVMWKIPSASPVALPTVTVAASDNSGSETAADPGAFTVTRAAASLSAALTVNFSLSGTALNSTDYNAIGTSVTIPAGASSANISIVPKTDALVEATETVILSLAAGAGYNLGSPASATVNVLNASAVPPALPTITVSASDPNAVEPSDNGTFTVTRTGSTTAALAVNYSLGGSALNGTDYNTIGTSVTIPPGAASANISILPKTDTLVEGTETVILSLTASAGYNLGSAASATVNLANAAPPVPALPDLTVTSFSISPAAPQPGQTVRFTATIKNQGTAAIPASTSIGLGFFVDIGTAFGTAGSAKAWTGLAGLAAGASATVTSYSGPEAGLWTVTAGTHQLAVYLDDLKGIPESNEGNNMMVMNLAAGATSVPVVVSLVTVGTVQIAPQVRFVSGQFQLTFASTPGRRYAVQASTNLINWVSFSTNTAAGASIVFNDPAAAGFSKRFYRALLLP